jgi:hypothetical protein
MTNSDQLKDPRFLILQQPNFRKPTMQYLRPDPFEIEEDPEPKKESIEIESHSYFEILCEIKLNDLIPPLLQESQ